MTSNPIGIAFFISAVIILIGAIIDRLETGRWW